MFKNPTKELDKKLDILHANFGANKGRMAPAVVKHRDAAKVLIGKAKRKGDARGVSELLDHYLDKPMAAGIFFRAAPGQSAGTAAAQAVANQEPAAVSPEADEKAEAMRVAWAELLAELRMGLG